MKKEVIVEVGKTPNNSGVHSKKQPLFSIDAGVGTDFKDWLNTPFCGGRRENEAMLSSKGL